MRPAGVILDPLPRAQAHDCLTGDTVLLKKLMSDALFDKEGVPQSHIREASLLQELQHPNIVRQVPTYSALSSLTQHIPLPGTVH